MKPISKQEFIAKLESDPLANLAGLRHALLLGDGARYFDYGEGRDYLIQFPKDLSRHDRDDYPEAHTISICTTGACLDALLGGLPPGKHVVKLNGELRDPRCSETNRFVSLTTSVSHAQPLWETERVVETVLPDGELLALFQVAHWSKHEIQAALQRGSRLYVLEDRGETVSACLVQNAYGKIEEIGALATKPEKQGRGYAKRLVGAVARVILEGGGMPRYHVNIKNQKSLAVAKGCGFTPFMTFCHYEFEVHRGGRGAEESHPPRMDTNARG
jgi:RimJ/RimL family protein N-acetyltransferase